VRDWIEAGRRRLARLRPGGGSGDEPARARFAELLERHLAEHRPPRVAVLEPAGGDWATAITASFPRARVVRIPLDDVGIEEQHALLAAGGRYDAAVAYLSTDAARVQNAFLHLKRGGALFLQRQRRDADMPLSWPGVLGDAVSSVDRPHGHVVLSQRRPVFAKLREEQADRVLELRGRGAGTVLKRLPAQTFRSRCELSQNLPERDPAMPEVYDVPPMSLRDYAGVTCLPRQVALSRNLVLPDTFRFNAAPELKHAFLEDVGQDFAVPKRRTKATRELTGSFFYLDSEWTHHFGHAMTEQMSRLWAVQEAKQRYPGLKAILSRRRGGVGLAEYERAIFGAAGFDEQDIVLHHRPVHVERLVAASPMFSLPTHAHPDLADVWRSIGATIAASAPEREYPRRLFCSRRRARRLCNNLEDVEAVFSAHGFAVVYPEDHPFPEQVRMFREAEVIAGFAGSGMFTAAFCPAPRRMIVLGPTSYPQRNEYMICAVAGHRLDYVWSRPDLESPPGGQQRYAGFTFDFGDEGVFLKDVLATL
jgi:capsular polysaccharide biosynthesis protein